MTLPVKYGYFRFDTSKAGYFEDSGSITVTVIVCPIKPRDD